MPFRSTSSKIAVALALVFVALAVAAYRTLERPKEVSVARPPAQAAPRDDADVEKNEALALEFVLQWGLKQKRFAEANGRFGTVVELSAFETDSKRFLEKGPAIKDEVADTLDQFGYRFEFSLSPDFKRVALTATPLEYGTTGIVSLFTDESRVVRGGDLLGARASADTERLADLADRLNRAESMREKLIEKEFDDRDRALETFRRSAVVTGVTTNLLDRTAEKILRQYGWSHETLECVIGLDVQVEADYVLIANYRGTNSGSERSVELKVRLEKGTQQIPVRFGSSMERSDRKMYWVSSGPGARLGVRLDRMPTVQERVDMGLSASFEHLSTVTSTSVDLPVFEYTLSPEEFDRRRPPRVDDDGVQ